MNDMDSIAVAGDLALRVDQLHYWARRAEQSCGNPGEAELAGRMLQAATADLEAFLTTLLDCFRPLDLAPTRMAVSDLVSAIAIRARGDVGAASVTVSGESDRAVSVDVALFTRALSAILRRLDPFRAALHVAVAPAARGGRDGVEIAFRADAEPSRRGKADLDWRLAGRIVALHAGALEERARARGTTIILFLPAA